MTLDRQWHGPSHGAAEADYNVMLRCDFNPRGVLEVFPQDGKKADANAIFIGNNTPYRSLF
ncbi:hypothetical protein [Bradyrhizobium genosp. P]|uniref:hypothetical protein n=1 Tax=Bradyrhizobium genosp. P TaxID=83641 RepID=UPI003CF7CB9A